MTRPTGRRPGRPKKTGAEIAAHVSDRFVQLWRHNGRPWCDVCDACAVHTPDGWRHASNAYPLGIPLELDTADHKVTADAWWNHRD